MIHHVSISARNPQHVAEVLAEVMHGQCRPFPPFPGSFMAANGDEHGTMVEVYPEDTTLQPGDGEDQQVIGLRGQTAPATCPFHFLLSVPADREEIERIGAREGWRTRLFGRGAPGEKPYFHVIEFWLENRLMVELAPETMIGEYTGLMRPAAMERALAERAAH
ncbi:MAG TPA: hypothetical protein VFW75_13205 [Acetobacteraceae bacterium]|nr:hypothetical protein [Acetobacteraceae bacterium]